MGSTGRSRDEFERALRRLLCACGVEAARRLRRAPDRGARVGLEARLPSGPIRRVQTYVEVHVGEIRTITELANVAGMSRAHFARRFHAETGEAPWAFVRRVRDAEAVRRLEAGEAPAEVAYGAGYADQAHLTRSLRRRTGRTPGEIRDAPRETDESTDVQDEAGVAD